MPRLLPALLVLALACGSAVAAEPASDALPDVWSLRRGLAWVRDHQEPPLHVVGGSEQVTELLHALRPNSPRLGLQVELAIPETVSGCWLQVDWDGLEWHFDGYGSCPGPWEPVVGLSEPVDRPVRRAALGAAVGQAVGLGVGTLSGVAVCTAQDCGAGVFAVPLLGAAAGHLGGGLVGSAVGGGRSHGGSALLGSAVLTGSGLLLFAAASENGSAPLALASLAVLIPGPTVGSALGAHLQDAWTR